MIGRRDAAVNEMNDREAELDRILRQFAGFIRLHLHKFAPQRFGLDSEDLYQEVRIKIWKVLRSEKEIKCLTSYIRKIVDSTVIDQLRKLRREENVYNYELERKTAELKSIYANSFSRGKEFKDLVARAAESLIDTRKKVVKLFLLNMSIEEIADVFQWSRDKTRNLLYRGLSDLRKILNDWTKADAD
ncbi:MAG: RNA polymerase sigma factor [Candidatus Aminicenantes bacterium]|nr:RNA polymerase sigma factor [Candidatus Aminicenantes bacterium]